ncbi:hypothetical protein CEXT_164171 [Caerostris extrusa]|uniref:Uncharacterized protein n=1 Tax=Caerostris extrusa TaxID=172846 RepID=A0AAV4MGK1_CAEEX|nr:hypothetical protein CEXT_164171 [Caerostris extrusa]
MTRAGIPLLCGPTVSGSRVDGGMTSESSAFLESFARHLLKRAGSRVCGKVGPMQISPLCANVAALPQLATLPELKGVNLHTKGGLPFAHRARPMAIDQWQTKE